MQLITACILWIAVATTTASPLFGWLGRSRHIIGGENARGDGRLYQVSLQKDGVHFCGGVVVSGQHVVTAAHCLTSGMDKIRVRAGSLMKSGGVEYQLHPAHTSIMHCYNKTSHECDIAVLKVTKVLPKNVVPISLTDSQVADNENDLTISGWGQTSVASSLPLPENLQEAKVKKINQSVCKQKYSEIGVITDNMICAGDDSKNICKGDSGGPLVDGKKRLVGIISWGAGYESTTSCDPKYPGVLTSVSSEKIRSFVLDALKS